MNINWSMWSAVAEVISSIAILVTLIYLSIQTRQNTAAIQANTRQTMVSNDLVVLNTAMDHPSVITKMMSNLELSDDEKHQLEGWLIMLVRTREYQWLQYKNGLLDKQAWEAYLSGLAVNLCYPHSHTWWTVVANDYFDREFVKEVDKYLKDNPIIENYTSPFDTNKSSAKV